MNGDAYTLKEWLFGAWLLMTAASICGLGMLFYTLRARFGRIREMVVAASVYGAMAFDLFCTGGGSFLRPMSGGTYPFLLTRLVGVAYLCGVTWYAYWYFSRLPKAGGGDG